MPAPPRASLFFPAYFPLSFQDRYRTKTPHPSPSPPFRRAAAHILDDARRYVSGLVRRQDREIARTIANKLLGILTARSTIISPDASLDYVTALARVRVRLQIEVADIQPAINSRVFGCVSWRDIGSFSHQNVPDLFSIPGAPHYPTSLGLIDIDERFSLSSESVLWTSAHRLAISILSDVSEWILTFVSIYAKMEHIGAGRYLCNRYNTFS